MGLYRKSAERGALNASFHLQDIQLWRAVFCEFFGTFVMIFVGMMNIVASEYDEGRGGQIDNLITPGLTFAAIIMTLIHIIGPTSHCHINPAVTLSLMICKRCHVVKGILYIPAQLLGATAGAGLTYWIAPPHWIEHTHLGMNRLNEHLNVSQGVAVELVGTMILVLLVLVISDPDQDKVFEGFPALSAGMMVMACVFFMAPYTGCSLNPARSFGPAFVMMDFADYHWIYYVGPFSGGIVAVIIYKVFLVRGLHQNSPVNVEKEKKKSMQMQARKLSRKQGKLVVVADIPSRPKSADTEETKESDKRIRLIDQEPSEVSVDVNAVETIAEKDQETKANEDESEENTKNLAADAEETVQIEPQAEENEDNSNETDA